MLVLGLFGVAGLVGVAVATAVHRWTSGDPAAPELATSEIRATVDRHPRLRALLRSRVDPAAATGLALSSAVLIFVAAATVIGVLAAMARTNVGVAHYDPSIASWAARHDTTSSTPILRFISQFGGALVSYRLPSSWH